MVEAASPLQLTGSMALHEQSVMTGQQLRAKVQFLCLSLSVRRRRPPAFLGFRRR